VSIMFDWKNKQTILTKLTGSQINENLRRFR
jgi:hypothetical protein